MTKLRLNFHVIKEYEVDPSYYPEGSTPEEMLAIDLEGANEDSYASMEGDNCLWTITGEVLGTRTQTAAELAIEALEAAKNGLAWYADTFPSGADGSDAEAMQKIDAAIAALQAELANLHSIGEQRA
jgi:hypothetical protein